MAYLPYDFSEKLRMDGPAMAHAMKVVRQQSITNQKYISKAFPPLKPESPYSEMRSKIHPAAMPGSIIPAIENAMQKA